MKILKSDEGDFIEIEGKLIKETSIGEINAGAILFSYKEFKDWIPKYNLEFIEFGDKDKVTILIKDKLARKAGLV